MSAFKNFLLLSIGSQPILCVDLNKADLITIKIDFSKVKSIGFRAYWKEFSSS